MVSCCGAGQIELEGGSELQVQHYSDFEEMDIDSGLKILNIKSTEESGHTQMESEESSALKV